MNPTQLKESYRKLEGANVARIEGDATEGVIEVTYMNGYRYTFRTVAEVESAHSALHPSHLHTPILGALLHGIIGA